MSAVMRGAEPRNLGVMLAWRPQLRRGPKPKGFQQRRVEKSGSRRQSAHLPQELAMRVALAFASGKHDAARIARAFPMSRATAYRYAHMLSEAREGRHDTNTITRSMWIADRLRGRAIDFDTVRELVPAMSRASVYRVLRFLKDARGEP